MTKKMLREKLAYFGVLGVIHEGVYFCGFIASEILRYYSIFKVVKVST